MDKWEHMIIETKRSGDVLALNAWSPLGSSVPSVNDASTRRVVEVLNELGEKGWQLVNVVGEDSPRYYFKRPSQAGRTGYGFSV